MRSYINIGCGQSPTLGWRNYDNSWSIKLAVKPLLTAVLQGLGMLSDHQRQFISFAKKENILWANAVQKIPEQSGSVDVVYSSHMIEHIERKDVKGFLGETRRILKSGGQIRIAVPDIRYHVENYLQDEDADKFIEITHLTRNRPRTILERMKYLLVGDRNHLWMYDGNSLCQLLLAAGFADVQVMPSGTTTIVKPGQLDLKERSPESVFVEAVNP